MSSELSQCSANYGSNYKPQTKACVYKSEIFSSIIVCANVGNTSRCNGIVCSCYTCNCPPNKKATKYLVQKQEKCSRC